MTAPAAPAVASAAVAAADRWLGIWSRPPDGPSQVALVLALALLAVTVTPRGPQWLASLLELATFADLGRRRRFLALASFAAAFLSLGYIAFYLRGGPRAPEAATYWLEGRALAHGSFAWATPEPSASFRVGGLLFRPPDRLSGTLPPGFPLLLAPAFLVGAPMLVGPLLAAALVLATWLVSRETALACGEADSKAEAIARAAVGLSVLSAALRRCTADAVPNGVSAVLVATALGVALRARRLEDARLFVPAGLAVGFLADTQPLCAVSVAAVVLALAWGARARWSALGLGLLGAAPCAGIWLLADHAATGHVWSSAAALYSSEIAPSAEGHPPIRETTLVALRGLRVHLAQVSNLEPLALVAAVPLLLQPRRAARGAFLTALVVGGQMGFTMLVAGLGELHGSGTGVLLCVVPLEHALIAITLARLFEQTFAQAALACCALSLGGFAVHASYDHEALARGGLGRPSYEPDEAREAGVAHGLLFFENDDGYGLAYDASVTASHGVEAVRMRDDDHDRLLYDLLGRPQTHRYVATALTVSAPSWTPPGGSSDTWRFEAENDWPPAADDGAWARVLGATKTCASDSRALLVTPRSAPGGSVTIALPLPRGATLPDRTSWFVTLRVMARGGAGSGTIDLVMDLGGTSRPAATWTWRDALPANVRTPACLDLPGRAVEVGKASRAWLVVRAAGGDVALDRTTLRPQ